MFLTESTTLFNVLIINIINHFMNLIIKKKKKINTTLTYLSKRRFLCF